MKTAKPILEPSSLALPRSLPRLGESDPRHGTGPAIWRGSLTFCWSPAGPDFGGRSYQS